MNSKQGKVLAAIFAEPTPSNIAWSDVENLLLAVGCTRSEGNGSRVRFTHGGLVGTFHRPHPAKEAKKYQVRDARFLLESIGVKP